MQHTHIVFDLDGTLVDTEDAVLRCKPLPDPLLLYCERTGREPGECIYVGDPPVTLRLRRPRAWTLPSWTSRARTGRAWRASRSSATRPSSGSFSSQNKDERRPAHGEPPPFCSGRTVRRPAHRQCQSPTDPGLPLALKNATRVFAMFVPFSVTTK